MLHRLFILECVVGAVLLLCATNLVLPGDQPSWAGRAATVLSVLFLAVMMPAVAFGLHDLGLALATWVRTGAWQ